MLVDSHCHLDHLDLSDREGGLNGVIDAAQARGITHFLSVAVDMTTSRSLIDLTAQFDNVYSSVGVHPLQKTPQPVPSIEELVSLAQQPRVVAIGETGLDNFYSSETIDWQRQSFVNHLQACQEIAKPVIIHTRDARDETIELLGDCFLRRRLGPAVEPALRLIDDLGSNFEKIVGVPDDDQPKWHGL